MMSPNLPETLLEQVPAAARADEAGGPRRPGNERGDSTPFPVCRLHDRRLVDGLPAGCPYRAEHRTDALAALQDEAYARLMQVDPSGLDLLRRVKICEVCRLPRYVLDRLKRSSAKTPAPSSPRPAPKARTHKIALRVAGRDTR